MASYMHTRDIKPEDLEPQKEPELTKWEKRKNWLYYMRWTILVIALGLALVTAFVVEMVTRVSPDISIGFVSPYTFPEEFKSLLAERLEELIEDYNGDGKVSVSIEFYQLQPDSATAATADPQTVMAETTRIAAIHQIGQPVIFIVEPGSAQYYQDNFALFGNWDGSFLDEGQPFDSVVVLWGETTVLSTLELDFTTTGYSLEDVEVTNMQELLAGYYVGVLPIWESQMNNEKTYSHWQASVDAARLLTGYSQS